MRVFADTNVIMEMLAGRAQADMVGEIFDWLEDCGCERFISVGSFYTLTFLIEKLFHQQGWQKPELTDELRRILEGIIDEFQISSIGADELVKGVADADFNDLEDSYQYQSAVASGCDIILTINTKDFHKALGNGVEILSPQNFKTKYIDKSLRT